MAKQAALKRYVVRKLFSDPSVIFFLSVFIGVLLFAGATLTAFGIAEGAYTGTNYFFYLLFGPIAVSSIWLCPFLYPLYGAMLKFGFFKTLSLALFAHYIFAAICTFWPEILPPSLDARLTPLLRKNFQSVHFYLVAAAPFLYFHLMALALCFRGITRPR